MASSGGLIFKAAFLWYFPVQREHLWRWKTDIASKLLPFSIFFISFFFSFFFFSFVCSYDRFFVIQYVVSFSPAFYFRANVVLALARPTCLEVEDERTEGYRYRIRELSVLPLPLLLTGHMADMANRDMANHRPAWLMFLCRYYGITCLFRVTGS